MSRKANWISLACLIICGVVCSFFLMIGRVAAERTDRQAAAAVFYSDIAALAAESGINEAEWLEMFSRNGVRYVVFRSWPGEGAEARLKELNMSPACAGSAEGDWAFVIPDGEIPASAEGVPLVLVEDEHRLSMQVPEAFDFEGYRGPMVKALYLYEEYADGYSEESGAQAVEDTMFRGVSERGLRLVLLRPFTDKSGTAVLDPAVYAGALSGLKARVEARGISFGEGVSCMETKPLRPILLWGSGLLTAALWIFLITRFRKLEKWTLALCVAAVIVLGCGCFLLPGLTQKGLALLCTVGFSCTGVYGMWRITARLKQRQNAAVGVYLVGVCALCGWSILGGLCVSALMADRRYLMGFTMFSGVNFSQMVPLALCAVLYGILVIRKLREQRLTMRSLLPILVVVLLGAVAAGVMMLRSGDVARISGIETAVRTALEQHLYARPRTKEFLIAVPIAALLVTGVGRKYPVAAFVGAMGAGLEMVSVANTFCHAVTPVRVSVIRTLLGAGIGFVLGVCLIAVCAAVTRLIEWRTKRCG